MLWVQASVTISTISKQLETEQIMQHPWHCRLIVIDISSNMQEYHHGRGKYELVH